VSVKLRKLIRNRFRSVNAIFKLRRRCLRSKKDSKRYKSASS